VTTIAYREGILAADSQYTYESEAGGHRKHPCPKLYRKETKDGAPVIIATQGDGSAGLVFVDWYGTGKKPPRILTDNLPDFTCLVLKRDGLYEYDAYCRPYKIELEFYAIGSGAKAALGAMHMGASAERAVEVACEIDPYTMRPIVVMSL
jgi:hypothetical protein